MSDVSVSSSQLFPPSSERNRPPFRDSMSAHTLPGLAGDAATPILPMMPSGIPGRDEMSSHVSPPSVERYRPLSSPPLSCIHGYLWAW